MSDSAASGTPGAMGTQGGRFTQALALGIDPAWRRCPR